MPQKVKGRLVPLSESTVAYIFRTAPNQLECITRLYREAFPTTSFSRMEAVDGWPSVAVITGQRIYDRFREFDRQHHPDVLAGALWFSKGFIYAIDVPEWHVQQCDYWLKDPEEV